MKYSWQRLGNGCYNKRKDYQMNWNITDRDLKRNIIAISNSGGPLAILMTLPSEDNSLVSNLHLITYTFKGNEIAKILWLDHIPVSLGWSSENKLISIFSDGTIRIFSPLLEQLQITSIKKNINSNGCIVIAKILPYGIYFVSSSYDVYYISCSDFSKCYRLTSIPLRCSPLEISATISNNHKSRESFIFPTNIFLPLEDYSIAILNIWDPNISSIINKDGLISVNPVDPAYLTDSQNPDLKERFIAFSISPNSEFLASLTESNIFSLRKTNNIFEKPFFSCKLSINFTKIKQLVWCGDDSVALNVIVNSNLENIPNNIQKLKNILYIGGIENQWLTYNYGKQSFILQSEIDGIKIQTSTHTEFIYKVPKCLESVFGIGSCEASAMLYFAYEKHISGDITTYHSLRAISSQLIEASKTCIEAAINVYYDEETYTKLLKIASFGKTFYIKSSIANPVEIRNWEIMYISACRDLRIIKAVNQCSAEFNTSIAQLRALGIKTLSSRLANHRCYLLSIKICEYCNISAHHVLSNWACDKIRHSIESTDEELADIIISKINGRKRYQSGSNCFSIIADEAARSGRPHLAILLLQHEPNLQKRVLMLLKLPAFKLAVEQSIRNKNIDLVYVCVVHLLYTSSKFKQLENENSQNHYWDSEIIETLVNIPEIIPFVIYYCTHLGETTLLIKLFEEIENYFDAGWVKIMLATVENDSILAKLEHLAHAAAYFSSSIKSKKNLEITKLLSNKSFNKSIQLLKNSIPQSSDNKQSISFIHSFNSSTDSLFEREAVISQIELLQYQINLDNKSKQASWKVSEIPGFSAFVGISLSNTIKYLSFLGLLDELQEMKKNLNIQDRLYWTYKIKGLAMGRRFQELTNEIQAINTSYPPISLEKIIDICIYYDARHIAAKIIPKLKDVEKQSYWYNRAGMYRETQQLRNNESLSVQSKIMSTFSGAFGGILNNNSQQN